MQTQQDMQSPLRRSPGLIVLIVMLVLTYSLVLLCKQETVPDERMRISDSTAGLKVEWKRMKDRVF